MLRFPTIFLIILILGIIVTVVTFLLLPGGGEETREGKEERPEGDIGIYFSVDGGSNWQALEASVGLRPITFALKVKDSGKFYIGTRGLGLWLAEDNGREISQVKDPDGILRTDAEIYSIQENKGGTMVYLALFQENLGKVLRISENKAKELYKTPLEGYGIFSVIVDRENERHLNISVGDGSYLESNDGGESWEVISRTREGLIRAVVHPTRSGKFWAIGNEFTFYSTETGGRVWIERGGIRVQNAGGERIRRIYDLAYDPFRQALIAGTDYGIVESTDDGSTWNHIPTPVPPQTLPITAVARHPRFGEVFWMAAQNQIYRTEDAGITWSRGDIPTNVTVNMLLVDSENPKRIYAGLSR